MHGLSIKVHRDREI